MFGLSERKAQIQSNCSIEAIQKACDGLGAACLAEASLGDMVAKLETLILRYYEDVRCQANQSFVAAKRVAWAGFGILALTLVYALIIDALARFGKLAAPTDMSMTVAKVGIVSGVLIEFIAGVNFWLYSRGARQFGAFHICLERTHRYLLAYKIADEIEIKGDRDGTLRNIACIMASAPMIARMDAANDARGAPVAASVLSSSPPTAVVT
jgi:hypothetical protein